MPLPPWSPQTIPDQAAKYSRLLDDERWLEDIYLHRSFRHLRHEDGEYRSTNLCERCSELNSSLFVSDAMGQGLAEPLDAVYAREEKAHIGLSRMFSSENGRLLSLTLLDETCPLCIFAVNVAQYSSRWRGALVRPWSPGKADALWLTVSAPPLRGFHNASFLVAAFTSPDGQPASDGSLYGLRVQPNAVNFALLRRWITKCREKHDCANNKRYPDPFGFRLIDCHAGELMAGRETGNAEYVTLSYVWGQKRRAFPHGLLDSATSYIREYFQAEKHDPGRMTFRSWLLNSRLPADVPRVVTDAIKVVTGLGYRYLWIDRYCIPQNKDDADSARAFAENIAVMGDIYAASALTIIAAAGDGPDHGLAGLTSSRIPQPAIKLGGRQIVGIASPAKAILDSVWNTRGWTFQEATLSSRRLVFTEHQVYFQCQEQQCVESLEAPIPFDNAILTTGVFPPFRENVVASDFGPRFDNQEEGDPWLPRNMLEAFGFIAKYAPREFSYPADAYDAFRGILEMFKTQKRPLHFFLGLPVVTPSPGFVVKSAISTGQREVSDGTRGPFSEVDELALALTWHPLDQISGYDPTRVYPKGISPKSMTRRREFPSWTWLGWSNLPHDCEYHIFHEDKGKGYQGYVTRRTYHLESAEIQFVGEQPVPWDREWRQLCDKAETLTVDCLGVNGWLMELSIDAVHFKREGKPTTWYVPSALMPPGYDPSAQEATEPWLLGVWPIEVFRGRDEDWRQEFAQKASHRFTCLLLTSIHSSAAHRATETARAVFGLLLLKELPEPNTYERFDFISMQAPHDYEDINKDKARIGPLVLRRADIRLK